MLLISLMIVNNQLCLAQEALVLPKGTPAPYTGLLIPETKALDLYNELSKYKLLSESYERSIALYKGNEEILDKKTKMLLDQNDDLAKKLTDARSTSSWEKAGWFALGFLSVMAGTYAIKVTTTQ